MSEDPKNMADSAAGDPFPVAETRVRPAWRRWVGFVLIPALAVVITIGALIWVRAEQGLMITVHFQEGHGVQPGNALKYRGIVIGEVVAVSINPELNKVELQIELGKKQRINIKHLLCQQDRRHNH